MMNAKPSRNDRNGKQSFPTATLLRRSLTTENLVAHEDVSLHPGFRLGS